MSDFETRLTEALASGAEDAPGNDGLAAGARTRARRRRRTRYATVAGAIVVALAVPVGALVLNGGGAASPAGNRVATDPSGDPAGWQTVEYEDVLVDVPGDWVRLDTSSCVVDDRRYGPRDSDPCTFDHAGVGIHASADAEPYRAAGALADDEVGWTGYVNAGTWVVVADAEDPDVARQILGSVRTEGQDAPDLSAGFRTVSYDGLSLEVPADWREGALSAWCLDESVPGWIERPGTAGPDVDCTPPYTGFGIRFHDGSGGQGGIRERSRPEFPDRSWAGIAIVPDGRGEPIGYVEVVAPTQGLAELIGGSLRVD